jgi:hypothetical protein
VTWASPEAALLSHTIMFNDPDDLPAEHAAGPADRAREKSDEFRMHAELAAVFEGVRKFDAQLQPGLDADIARNLQRTIGKLEKSRSPEGPILPESMSADAKDVLTFPAGHNLSTNDYHIHRRPGEVMVLRWLAGEQVETYYQRLQAHFDAAIEGFREDEHQALDWKQEPKTQEYLTALDAVKVEMAHVYLRETIRVHNLFVLSTQSADELDILHLTDYVMGIAPEDLVGPASAPPPGPSDQDRAWFFKLFSLRGMDEGIERMCFFAFLQKTDEGGW